MSKITKSSLKKLIKECIKDMIREGDPDIVSLLGEGVANNKVEKVVGDPELWDSLVEVATGSTKSFKMDNKRIRTPNSGVGYKSEKKINEWVKGAYDKFGGNWVEKSKPISSKNDAIKKINEALISNKEDSVQNTNFTTNTSFVNDPKAAARGEMSDDFMAQIFADTAQNTLPKQRKGAAQAQAADGAAQAMRNADPTEIFADQAGKWSNLAFDS